MFNGKLFNFQTKHEENLLSKCADHEEMVLYAPTGSGKTVMVCKFIDDYLDENPNTAFYGCVRGQVDSINNLRIVLRSLHQEYSMVMFIRL